MRERNTKQFHIDSKLKKNRQLNFKIHLARILKMVHLVRGLETSSSSFVLEFVAVLNHGINMVRGNRWTTASGIMTELINTFEKWPRDVTMVEKEAAVNIREWWEDQTQNHGLFWLDAELLTPENLIIEVKGLGRIKTVFIHFDTGILMIFEIKQKQKMSLLRTLAAEKVSGFITKREDIKQLEVPDDVMNDLNKAYDDCWRVQYNTADS